MPALLGHDTVGADKPPVARIPGDAVHVAGTGGDVGEDGDTPHIRAGAIKLDGATAQRLTFERFGYLLLDRAGRVVWRHAGPCREEDYALLAAEARRQLTP